MNFEIERMAIVSTGHLPQTELQALQTAPDYLPILRDDYGVTVFTHCQRPEHTPYANDILQAASDDGIEWVKFDCDGPIYDEFPTFDW